MNNWTDFVIMLNNDDIDMLHDENYVLYQLSFHLYGKYRIAGYFRGGKFSRISRIGLDSRIFSP